MVVLRTYMVRSVQAKKVCFFAMQVLTLIQCIQALSHVVMHAAVHTVAKARVLMLINMLTNHSYTNVYVQTNTYSMDQRF